MVLISTLCKEIYELCKCMLKNCFLLWGMQSKLFRDLLVIGVCKVAAVS